MLGRCVKGESCDFFHPKWQICNWLGDACGAKPNPDKRHEVGSAKAGQCSAKATEDISKTNDAYLQPGAVAIARADDGLIPVSRPSPEPIVEGFSKTKKPSKTKKAKLVFSDKREWYIVCGCGTRTWDSIRRWHVKRCRPVCSKCGCALPIEILSAAADPDKKATTINSKMRKSKF